MDLKPVLRVMSRLVYKCIYVPMNVTTMVGGYFELFHLTCHLISLHSQNEKQDSEMMAVRTADKLLKVNRPLCFLFVLTFELVPFLFLRDIHLNS